MELSDLKVIVTGAARGRLAQAGAAVAAADVDEAGLADLPPGIERCHTDVSKPEDCAALVGFARKKLGGVNALINNAGIIRDQLVVKQDRETGQIRKFNLDDWHAVLAVNLSGAFYMIREFVADLVEHDTKPGVIVNMSSVARHGNRGQSNYVSAKAALAANTVTWAREFARFGIRVGAVAPGMVETPMTRGMNQKARDAAVAAIPVGRIGEPEDLWLAVKFVLECDYFTGSTIDVHGGLGT
jgi:3-oxoacyl-[acyl-carrier protein] reductase